MYEFIIFLRSTLESTVKWKKDGNKLKKGVDNNKNYQGHIYVDNFNVLHLSHITKDQEGAYKCYVDGIFIQQIDIRINIDTIFVMQGMAWKINVIFK